MKTITVAVPEIAVGRSAIVEVDGARILLCRSTQGLHALDEICPHQEKSLEGGRVRGLSLICPHHGARFSLTDGSSMSPVTPNSLKLFPCTEAQGEACIIVDGQSDDQALPKA
jgi:3-phenylpropionate/trans-cinnamate dioxygenase ferredoxin subunit